MRHTDLRGANLTDADLRSADLGSANLTGAVLTGAKMDRAQLGNADLTDVTFVGATWVEARFNRQTKWPTNFAFLTAGMYGPGVDYSGQNLSGRSFHSQDFYGAKFSGANLQGCDLRYTDLRGADLTDADLRAANLGSANLIGTIYNSSTQWPNEFDYVAAGAILGGDKDLDGILDPYETGTGIYRSLTNTGSLERNADTDGDGGRDGAEVAYGSNPNRASVQRVPGSLAALYPLDRNGLDISGRGQISTPALIQGQIDRNGVQDGASSFPVSSYVRSPFRLPYTLPDWDIPILLPMEAAVSLSLPAPSSLDALVDSLNATQTVAPAWFPSIFWPNPVMQGSASVWAKVPLSGKGVLMQLGMDRYLPADLTLELLSPTSVRFAGSTYSVRTLPANRWSQFAVTVYDEPAGNLPVWVGYANYQDVFCIRYYQIRNLRFQVYQDGVALGGATIAYPEMQNRPWVVFSQPGIPAVSLESGISLADSYILSSSSASSGFLTVDGGGNPAFSPYRPVFFSDSTATDTFLGNDRYLSNPSGAYLDLAALYNVKLSAAEVEDYYRRQNGNIAPTIQLSQTSFSEGPAGSLATEVMVLDPEGDTFTTTLGGADASRFILDTSVTPYRLLLAQDFDYEPDGTSRKNFYITLAATDGTGQVTEQDFQLTLLDNRQEDADGDCLTEQQEEDLYGSSDLSKDTDGDGVTDKTEVADGTNPADPNSYRALNRGLIAFYPMSGNARDGTGYCNHAQVFGGATLGPDRFGVVNSSYQFNGQGQYLEASHANHLNTLPLSMGFWFRTATTDLPTSELGLVGKYRAEFWNGYQAIMQPDGTIWPWYVLSRGQDVIGRYDVNGDNNPPFQSAPLNDAQWHHMVFTIDSGGGKMYVDGQLVSQKDWRGTPTVVTSDLPLTIGQYLGHNSPTGSFHGSIDEVRLYNRALSANEVLELANEGKVGPSTFHISMVDIRPTWPVLLGYPDFMPETPVTLPDYSIAKDEITYRSWTAVKDLAKSRLNWDLPAGTQGSGYTDTTPDHPATRINLLDTTLWCNALSLLSEVEPCYYVFDENYNLVSYTPERRSMAEARGVYWKQTAQGYRIPSGNEWEVAARGGLVSKRYPWGDEPPGLGQETARANWVFGYGNPESTTPVGTYSANGYGLTDMAGNSWEFTWDDKLTPVGEIPVRLWNDFVIRGGGWNAGWDPRISANYGWNIGLWDGRHEFGFRIAKGAQTEPDLAKLDSDGDGLSDAWERGYGRYQIIPGSYSWAEAKDAAKLVVHASGIAGRLGIIPSNTIQGIVKELLRSFNSVDESVWIGGSKINGIWTWINSQPVTYSQWGGTEPTDGPNEDLLSITMQPHHLLVTGDWNNDYSTSRYPYLLEFGFSTDPFNADTDGDGFDDKVESLAGTDPNDRNVHPEGVPLDPNGDEDGDGLTNGQELTLGTDPRKKDTDSDGVNDPVEIADGTNPNDPSSCNNLNKGLVAYYPFNGNANDASGNGQNGDSLNVSYVADRMNNSAQAASFNGSSSSVAAPFRAMAGLTDFSVSTWFNPATPGRAGTLELVHLSSASDRFDCTFNLSWGFQNQVQVLSGNVWHQPRLSPGKTILSGDLPVNSWVLATMTYSGGVMRLFVNGQLVSEDLVSGRLLNFPLSPQIHLGFDSVGDYFAGKLDEVRIYNRALSTAEVSQLYARDAGNLDQDGDGLTDAWENGYGRYQIVSGNFTWEQAKADAESKGGHLVTITTEAEWRSIESILSQNGLSRWLWAGASDADQESLWKWVTGETWSYSRWASGEPSGARLEMHSGENYLVLNQPHQVYSYWNDFFVGEDAMNRPGAYLLEFGYPTDPTKADTDGDGVDDKTESLAGTDPNDSGVYPELPDRERPVITLLGDSLMTLNKGATFTDPGATVTDNRDATRTITGTGTVNTSVVGTYTVTYSATDSAGNEALAVQREVRVLPPSPGDQAPALSFARRWTGGTTVGMQNIVHGGGVYFGFNPWGSDWNNSQIEPKIAYTTDGLSWQDLSMGVMKREAGTYSIKGLAFNGQDWLAVVQLNTYWYSGNNVRILKSQNMGLSWQVTTENSPLHLLYSDLGALDDVKGNLRFADGLWIFIASRNPAKLWTSPDGVTWTDRTPAGATRINDFAAGDVSWIVVNENGKIFRTMDQGVSWASVETGTTENLRSVAYGNNRFVVTGERGVVLTSNDQGSTLIYQATGTTGYIGSVNFGNDLFVSWNGKSSYGGILWTQPSGGWGGWQGYVFGDAGWIAPGSQSVQVGYPGNRWEWDPQFNFAGGQDSAIVGQNYSRTFVHPEATSYRAYQLPAGLSHNQITGEISGVPTRAGTYEIVLYPVNSAGAGDYRTYQLVIRNSGIEPPSEDTQKPEITLLGANPLTLYKNGLFTDPGAQVVDNKDATRTINGVGSLDVSRVGDYILTYTATDAAGNVADPKIRTVQVILDPAADEDTDGVPNGLELSYGTDPTKEDTDGDGLSDGYELGFGRYEVVTGSFTWDQARLDAEAKGGHLLTVSNAQEWQMAQDRLGASMPSENYWMGGRWMSNIDYSPGSVSIRLIYPQQEGWKWVTGEKWDYTNWGIMSGNITIGSNGIITLGNGNVTLGNVSITTGSNGWLTIRNDAITSNGYLQPMEPVGPCLGGKFFRVWGGFGENTLLSSYILERGAYTSATLADTDGDGANDKQEIDAGTDPNDSQVYPSLLPTPYAGLDVPAEPSLWTFGGPAWTTKIGPLSSRDRNDVAISGSADNQTSWMQRTIQGPAYVDFWWRGSSEADFDYFSYSVDGTVREEHSGERGWQKVSFFLAAGSHTVRWSYEKDESEASGEDALFVDELSVVPAAADLRISQGGGPVISPWTVDFGSVLERAAFVDQILTLSNQGNLPMTLSLSLPVGSGFELLNAPSRLEPNQVVDVTVRMLTSTAGAKSTFLAINAPGSATPPPLVQLTGNVLPKVAVFELTQAGSPAASGSTYALGNLPQTISFTIRNAGTDVLRPVANVLSGEVNILNSPTSEIAPGDSSTLVLLFSPGSSGSKTAEISIRTNDLNHADTRITLTGTSVLPNSGARGVTLGQTGGGTGWQVGSDGELSVTGGPNNSQSYLEATYQGPGLLSWSWKTQVQQGNDALICLVNNQEVVRISTKKGVWEDRVATLPDGVCTVRWVYQKDGISWSGQDKVSLASIAYRPFEGARISMRQWATLVRWVDTTGVVIIDEETGETVTSWWSLINGRIPGGLNGMLAFAGGVNPGTGPIEGEYTPVINNGKISYRYGINKHAAGNMQQRPLFSSDLDQWSNQGISQKVVSEDHDRVVVEVTIPDDQPSKGFFRIQAWGDPN